ncbi:MAG: GYD domain-containing protein [Acidimicrobiales bacterium]|nr:GYD domain-containing protein [Acidimicrobiales bacterium]
MSKYLIRGSYKPDGVKGLMQEGGSKRLAAATAAIESVGGSIDSFYYAFGDDDVVGICDFPDAASATALSMMINSSGAVTLTLTPLMTVEEVDAAAAMTPTYRPPGA